MDPGCFANLGWYSVAVAAAAIFLIRVCSDQGQERARRAVAIFRNLTFTPFNAQVLGEVRRPCLCPVLPSPCSRPPQDSQFVQTLLRVCALADEHRVCAQQALEALYNCAKYIPLTAGSVCAVCLFAPA